MHRSDIDDRAAGAGVHMAQARAGGQEGAVEMHRQQLAPIGEGEILDRGDDLDAGVAHQHVHASERPRRLGDAGIDRRLAGHVHREAERGAARLPDFAGRRLGRGGVKIGDHRVRTFAREGTRDLPPDAAARARHQRRLAREPCHAKPPCRVPALHH